jgi:hypothetical protein
MSIDFDEMKWGSFTDQMKAYNREHDSNHTLEQFAKLVLSGKGNFRERTKDRARFYLNVILKQKSGGSTYAHRLARRTKNTFSQINDALNSPEAQKVGEVMTEMAEFGLGA